MAGGAESTSSAAKRAKVDGADEEEEEHPHKALFLLWRKREVVRLLEEASAKGRDNARAKEELMALCARLEAKNEKRLSHFRRLPAELWQKIVDENDLLALAMTCRFFRDTTKDLGWKLETNLSPHSLFDRRKSGNMPSHSFGWYRWVCDTFEILTGFKWPDVRVKGAVYGGDLLNCAALQGSVEILRWLHEEKGCELHLDICDAAGFGGNIEVLEYTVEARYTVNEMLELEDACYGAALGGHLEALKFLKCLDPPCPWHEVTCWAAAWEGHLDVLKWARDQDPPCPWNWETCSRAAIGGHLDVLMWARSQDPPCPWGTSTCSSAAWEGHLNVL